MPVLIYPNVENLEFVHHTAPDLLKSYAEKFIAVYSVHKNRRPLGNLYHHKPGGSLEYWHFSPAANAQPHLGDMTVITKFAHHHCEAMKGVIDGN